MVNRSATTPTICLNPHHDHIGFYMPAAQRSAWDLVLDTANKGPDSPKENKAGESYDMWEHSAVIFCEAVRRDQPPPIPEPEKVAKLPPAPRKARKKAHKHECQ